MKIRRRPQSSRSQRVFTRGGGQSCFIVGEAIGEMPREARWRGEPGLQPQQRSTIRPAQHGEDMQVTGGSHRRGC